MGLASCGSIGSLIVNSLWLIAVDPHRGGAISLLPPSPWRPSMSSSSGMASSLARLALCPSQSLNLVCKILKSLLGLSETNTIGYLAMNGAALHEIAEVLGHKTLQMTKRYA